MNTFGERLRDARKQAKLTQKDVAKRIGMSQPLLSELENNEYPTSGFTTKLAYLYKVSARWLAEGKGPREASSSEILDDPDVMRVWNAYSGQDEATKAMVDFLLGGPDFSRPSWMSLGAAASIENARQLISEQMARADPNELDNN
ncbi:helix-turn-helix transcriptional regulator [Pusillimonas sp. ANT_WB101]|uniref:helix-turn-helix domain-containing protein n=1 Tax=Pusillimonas sp. ANT_WB101 TaxID=2597356 RepID=UPI0011EC7D0A|nr:helix-turn-helix transcriptional regulator [Pusillimonas sp. ANT_WB101]KAA0910658.1 helix-turn-helix transcriptional regulator [Pusillimonas sp. ANT_WB101]